MSTFLEWLKHPWQKITFRLLRLHFNPDVHLILRFPPRKRLYTHELGMTLAYLLALSIILLQYLSSPWQCLELIVIFTFGTFYLGGFFLFFICLAIIFSYLSPLLKLFLFDLISRPITCILYSEITSFRPFNLLAFDILHYIMMILYPLFVYYILGYIFGASLSVIHRYTMQLHLLSCQSDKIKIACAFDAKEKLNIIKSPIEQEEFALLSAIRPLTYYTYILKNNSCTEVERAKCPRKIIRLIKKAYRKMKEKEGTDLMVALNVEDDEQFKDKMDEIENKLKNPQTMIDNDIISELEDKIEPLVEKYLKLKMRKLYNYRIKIPDNHIPYTIAFVANPAIGIKKKQIPPLSDVIKGVEPDPIITDKELFLNSVHRALRSFEQDSVLGRPEIWSRIRVVAIFDKAANNEHFLVQPISDRLEIDDRVVENILDPADELFEHYQEMLDKIREHSGIDDDTFENIKNNVDVIFAMSANFTYTRSSSHYSEWKDIPNNIILTKYFDQYLKIRNLPNSIRKEFSSESFTFKDISAFDRKTSSILDPLFKRYENIIRNSVPRSNYYQLTKNSINKLREINLPRKILLQLSKFEDFYKTKKGFSIALNKILIKEDINNYEKDILNSLETVQIFSITLNEIASLRRKKIPQQILDQLIKDLELSQTKKVREASIQEIIEITKINFKSIIHDALLILLYNKDAQGKIFHFNSLVHMKNKEISNAQCSPYIFNPFTCLHEYYPTHPGTVALNVLDATDKSYIHEFAHAMSSFYHGIIADEYYDRIEVYDETATDKDSNDVEVTPFCVNRMERRIPDVNRFIAVHTLFAHYNRVTYLSDRNHPSAKEHWLSYYPERITPFENCIMDRNYSYYRFDKLLRNFIYDRLHAKLNRVTQ